MIHVVLFEAGLLIFTIPVMAFILHVSLWEAFILDLGVTLYVFLFNFIDDNVRVSYLQNREVIS
ncbi:hypothetical protein CXF74_16535 [Psychromonas sp. Urea-02u-13]|nr:hypothetical protein CXF74_16535 [Psychromonas sp. Urea-02u-13]